MELMNRYLPRHHFAETHSLHVPAAPAHVLAVVGRADVVDDPVARRLIALREWPNRLAGRIGFAAALQGRPAFGLANFTDLGQDGDRERAFGVAGRFWQSDYGLIDVPDAPSFLALEASGIAKLVMNFCAGPEGRGTRLTTCTRVWCCDEAARRRFLPYWLLIRPASGLIRQRLLRRARDAVLREAT